MQIQTRLEVIVLVVKPHVWDLFRPLFVGFCYFKISNDHLKPRCDLLRDSFVWDPSWVERINQRFGDASVRCHFWYSRDLRGENPNYSYSLPEEFCSRFKYPLCAVPICILTEVGMKTWSKSAWGLPPSIGARGPVEMVDGVNLGHVTTLLTTSSSIVALRENTPAFGGEWPKGPHVQATHWNLPGPKWNRVIGTLKCDPFLRHFFEWVFQPFFGELAERKLKGNRMLWAQNSKPWFQSHVFLNRSIAFHIFWSISEHFFMFMPKSKKHVNSHKFTIFMLRSPIFVGQFPIVSDIFPPLIIFFRSVPCRRTWVCSWPSVFSEHFFHCTSCTFSMLKRFSLPNVCIKILHFYEWIPTSSRRWRCIHQAEVKDLPAGCGVGSAWWWLWPWRIIPGLLVKITTGKYWRISI